MPPPADLPEPIDFTDRLPEFGIELPPACLSWRVLAHFHIEDAEPGDDVGPNRITEVSQSDWHFYKACLAIVDVSSGRTIGMCQVRGLELDDIDSADGMGDVVHHLVTTALDRFGLEQVNLPELPPWPDSPPEPIELDTFHLRLWYGVALPAECDYRVRLTFAHDTETEPAGLSAAGLAQLRRGEWSYYTTTATVSDARGDVVDSQVARGLRREQLHTNEAAYGAVNDAVFAAIETWNRYRAQSQ